jgi:hypothetical protein
VADPNEAWNHGAGRRERRPARARIGRLAKGRYSSGPAARPCLVNARRTRAATDRWAVASSGGRRYVAGRPSASGN